MSKLEELIVLTEATCDGEFHQRCDVHRHVAEEIFQGMADRVPPSQSAEVLSGVMCAAVYKSLQWKPDGISWQEMMERTKAIMEIYFVQAADNMGLIEDEAETRQ